MAITKEEIARQAAAALPIEKNLANLAITLATVLGDALQRRSHRQLTLAEQDMQARLAAVIVTGSTPAGIEQLHNLLHLIAGYAKRQWPDPALQTLRALRVSPPEKAGPPDVIVREHIDMPPRRREEND